MLKFLNKGISTPMAIAIIFVVATIAGIVIYWQTNSQERTGPIIELPGKEVKQAEEKKELEEIIDEETADWTTYNNEEFGFEFKYPSPPWTLYPEAEPPFSGNIVYAIVIAPKGTIYNAPMGHIMIMDVSLEEYLDSLGTYEFTGMEDFNSISFSGIKFQHLFSSKVKQIDYVYFLELDGKVIYINFKSIDTPEMFITPDLLEQIDKFVTTFSLIK